MARPLHRLLHWRRLSCQARHHAAAELFCHCFGSRRNTLRRDGGQIIAEPHVALAQPQAKRSSAALPNASVAIFRRVIAQCPGRAGAYRSLTMLPSASTAGYRPSRIVPPISLHILPLQGTWETRSRFIFGQLLGRCFVLGKDFIEGTALRTLAQFGVPFEVSGEPKILLVYPRLPRITAKVAHQNPRIEICSPAGPSWNRKLPPGTGRPPGVTNSRTGFIR